MNAEPTPIRWRNLARWLRETRRVDDLRRTEKPSRRATAGRLVRMALPSVRRPLFVLGAPRSGTSFLGDALGGLPEFTYHYEPPLTKAAARYVHEGRWSFARAALLYRFTYWWLAARRLEADLRFAEKTPQNAFVIGFLARAFPGAQFVHIVRDGRDAALSYRSKPWLRRDAGGSGKRESGGYPFGPWARYWVEPERRAEFEATSDLHRCLWAWRRHTESALAQGAALPAGRYLEVRYERLAQDPLPEAHRLLDFLGIAAADSRRLLHARLGRARPQSVGRWQQELQDDERALVEQEAGALLRRLGYAADGGP